MLIYSILLLMLNMAYQIECQLLTVLYRMFMSTGYFSNTRHEFFFFFDGKDFLLNEGTFSLFSIINYKKI